MVLAFQIQSNIISNTLRNSLEKASPQEQLQYFYDYQLNQDVAHCLLKTAMIYTIFGVLSLKVPQVLFAGSVVFAIQSFALGNFFLATPVASQTADQDDDSSGFLWLAISCLIIITELLILCLIPRTS